MKLVVFSTKPCWFAPDSPSGFSTNGGFPYQMRTLSELFDGTTLVVPCLPAGQHGGDEPLTGHNLRVVPLPYPTGFKGWRRKAGFPLWLLRTLPVLLRELLRADAMHAPVPGDIGTVGMVLAVWTRKPLLVRHCGNWLHPKTTADRFLHRFMERHAGGRNVMLATGGGPEPPSPEYPAVKWIFSSSLTRANMQACAVVRERDPRLAPRLIIVGRQEESKGTDIVIAGLPEIACRFPGVHFDIVGEGGGLAKFRAQAASLKVADRVTFHGSVAQEEVLRLLRAADLFVFPTASEGFPKAVLEAFASGLPVVTTAESVLPHLLSRGGGMLMERHAEALTAAVTACLEDPEKYREMSRAAFETAASYSLENWRDTIGGWLREAWGRPTKSA